MSALNLFQSVNFGRLFANSNFSYVYVSNSHMKYYFDLGARVQYLQMRDIFFNLVNLQNCHVFHSFHKKASQQFVLVPPHLNLKWVYSCPWKLASSSGTEMTTMGRSRGRPDTVWAGDSKLL